jgi:cytochrome c556
MHRSCTTTNKTRREIWTQVLADTTSVATVKSQERPFEFEEQRKLVLEIEKNANRKKNQNTLVPDFTSPNKSANLFNFNS